MATAFVVLLACETASELEAGANDDAIDGVWRPMPVAMRVHPATQYRLLDDMPVLEVRIELSDAMGDPIKASARYRFELVRDGVGMDEQASRIYQWDEVVRSERDHVERYDAVTRSYVFPLSIDSFDAAGETTRLRARAALFDGRSLEASAPVVAD